MRGVKLVGFAVAALLLSACGPSEEEIAAAQAGFLEETHAVETVIEATAQVLQLTEDARAAEVAATATQQHHVGATETAASEATAAAFAAQTATAEAEYSLATAQASPMYQQVLELASEGWLSRTEGTYHPLPDFNQTWAQIYWYRWWYTEYSPADFVLRVHARMDDDSSYANSASACGVVFREQGEDNHYQFAVNMYGRVSLRGVYKGQGKWIDGGTYSGTNIRTEELDFILVVDGDAFHVLVNGGQVLTGRDDLLREGNLGLSLTSGTNRGFGSMCHMTDIELWVLN